jgi:hypothetical protein
VAQANSSIKLALRDLRTLVEAVSCEIVIEKLIQKGERTKILTKYQSNVE